MMTASDDISTRIAFLLIHDQPHQVPHIAPILSELTKHTPRPSVTVFIRNAQSHALLLRLLPSDAKTALDIRFSEESRLWTALEAMIAGAAPLRRLAFLRQIAPELIGFDAIVVPESTSIRLKKDPRIAAKFIHTGHGALHRDRGRGFRPDLVAFDHLLVVGGAYEQRLLKEGVVSPDAYSIVGYPKFDATTQDQRGQRFFGNDNPVVLYNPHPHPKMSSWFRHGEQVLDIFANNPGWNLIFAPHIMLFRKKLHMTADLRHFNWLKKLPDRFNALGNIHIDLGSLSSVDMTYTASADIYLGDLSSQVFEFISRPRPCVFMNSAGVDWQNTADVPHWQAGQVIDTPAQLLSALSRAQEMQDTFQPIQNDMLTKIFGQNAERPSRRAADAILKVAGAPRP